MVRAVKEVATLEVIGARGARLDVAAGWMPT